MSQATHPVETTQRLVDEYCQRAALKLAAAAAGRNYLNAAICSREEFPKNYLPVVVDVCHDSNVMLSIRSVELDEIVAQIQRTLRWQLLLHSVPFRLIDLKATRDVNKPTITHFTLWVWLLS